MSSSNCCFLTCIQISQEAGQVVWYSHFLKNFPQFIVIHTVKGFGIVNKAEIDVFLELSCFFDDQWSSALNSPIPVHFSSLIPRMSMLILTISCLTMSDFPWFMDLTFQFLYSPVFWSIGFYFHHQTHPQLSNISTSAQLLHSFSSTLPQQHIGHLRPAGLIFWCHIFLAYYTVPEVLTASILGWFASCSESRFVRTLYYDLSVLGGPA